MSGCSGLLCRRIANRESARRVRQKRQDVMEELQIKVGPQLPQQEACPAAWDIYPSRQEHHRRDAEAWRWTMKAAEKFQREVLQMVAAGRWVAGAARLLMVVCARADKCAAGSEPAADVARGGGGGAQEHADGAGVRAAQQVDLCQQRQHAPAGRARHAAQDSAGAEGSLFASIFQSWFDCSFDAPLLESALWV